MDKEQLAEGFVKETILQRIELALERNPTVEKQNAYLRHEAAKVTEHQLKIRGDFDALFELVGFKPKGESPEKYPDIILGEHDDPEFGKGMLVGEVTHYPSTNAVGTYVKFIREDGGKNVVMYGGSVTPGNFGDDYVEYARTAIDDSDGQFKQALSNLHEEEESLKSSEEIVDMMLAAASEGKLNPEFVIRADISNPQQP